MPLWNYAVLRGQVPDLRREGVFFTAIDIMATHCQTSLCLASLNLLLLPLPFETQLFKQFFTYLFYFWLCWVFIAAYESLFSCGEQGLLFSAVSQFLSVVASLDCRAWALGKRALWALKRGLTCPSAGRIFLHQALKPCPSHW